MSRRPPPPLARLRRRRRSKYRCWCGRTVFLKPFCWTHQPSEPCSADGCGRPAKVNGLCASHQRNPGKQLRPYRRTPWQVALDAFYELDAVNTLSAADKPAIARAEANLRVAMIRYGRTPKPRDPHRKKRRRSRK